MKREWIAFLLLGLLIAGSALNIACADRLTDLVSLSLVRAENAAGCGDFKTARINLENGLSVWLNAKTYTSVFLRHAEVDSATDAFYELQQLLLQEDKRALPAAFAKLRYHLGCIDDMEHPSVGTIF